MAFAGRTISGEDEATVLAFYLKKTCCDRRQIIAALSIENDCLLSSLIRFREAMELASLMLVL